MPPERSVPFATPPRDVAALVARREAAQAAEKTARDAAFFSGSLAGFAFMVGCAVAVLARVLDWIGHFDQGNLFSHIVTQSFALMACKVLLWLAIVLGVCVPLLIAAALRHLLRAGRLKAARIDLDKFDAVQPPISRHRRYVVPADDLDHEGLHFSDRVVGAAAEIPGISIGSEIASGESSVVGHAFISYVRADSPKIDQLQQALEAAGVAVWRDTANLWPGEDWRAKIRHAITDHALAFIVCFSTASISREKSYQNEELLLAIDQIRLRPPDDPWLIPVRLDECEIPDREIGAGRTLASFQRADLFGDRADENTERLVTAVLRILGRHSSAAK